MFTLIAVFGQLRFEDRTGYQAVFTNISGLKSGNFVRIAGVEVGKVGDLDPAHRDGTVTGLASRWTKGCGSARAPGLSCATKTSLVTAISRWKMLPGPPGRLPPGSTIPLARTSPALDIDALIGGFRPLFRALDPDQAQCPVRPIAANLPGPGRHSGLGAVHRHRC